MDNLCHTLAGAALGEAGLKGRTRFGNPVLMIAANLPDIDILSIASGMPVVAFRRGWTHGVLAQALLPVALTGVVLLMDRLWRPRAPTPPARAAPLLVLSYVGVISHVLLDWLNTYGVRLLMPFSNQWFYGDSVFIIDPWLWLLLGAGVLLARRRRRPAAARVALAVAVVYAGLMVFSAMAARQIVLDRWRMAHGRPPEGLMVGPVAVDPFRKSIIVNAGDRYETGTFRWWPRSVVFDQHVVPRRDDHPLVVQAREHPRVRAVLVWARFPYYELERLDGRTRVTLRDMRFGSRVGETSVVVTE